MRAIRLLILLMVTAVISAPAVQAGHGGTGSPGDIIYDLTVPWPFHRSADRQAVGDADGDGVPDNIDRCPRTPRGARVDAHGCPIDSDGDGVPDGIDQCPDTPRDLAVDRKGCPIPINELGQELLDDSSVALHVLFAFDKAEIRPESHADLDRIGEVLIGWPAAKLEIAGHTDSKGTDEYNQRLSERRAAAVKTYLTKKFPRINATNLVTRGFGESKPVASNNTDNGRAKNRRVEFTLLNAGELKKDIEKMRYKKRSE